MVTSKKPPKKKLPTGPTKADLLSRMGVNKQPQLLAPPRCQESVAEQQGAVGKATPGHLEPTPLADLPQPPKSRVGPVNVELISPAPVLTKPVQEPTPVLAASQSEAPLPDGDPWPGPPPDPVEVEKMVSPALLPSVRQADQQANPLQRTNTVLPAELLLSSSACPDTPPDKGNDRGVQRNGTHQPDPLPPSPSPESLPHPRDALDVQLGLQKITLKCSAHVLEKLGSLESSTGLPGEILIEVLLDHWEQLPKPVQQDCLMQAHRIRVERLVMSQNYTIAAIEQLLREQNWL